MNDALPAQVFPPPCMPRPGKKRMPGKYALLAVIQPPTASAPARAVPKVRKRRRLIVLSPIVVGSRIDCRRVAVAAHEPPHQRPREALLRRGEGLPPLLGVRAQRHV